MSVCVLEVRDGLRCSPAGAGVARWWANRGQCGGEVVEGPCERCTRVSDGDCDEFYTPPILLEGRDEGEYFSVFSACLLSHPKSRENPITIRRRVHRFLSKVVRPGSGVFGPPLAYMRSGVVP